MPFVPLFSVTQSSSDFTEVSSLDLSTGTDAAITQRRIFFTKSDGTYLTTDAANDEDYFQWALATNPLTIADLLDKDYALSIVVQWLDVSNAVLYSKTVLYDFSAYEQYFLYNLTTAQASNPALLNNQNFYLSKVTLRCQVDDAEQAVVLGSDIYSAQAANNRGMFIVNNPKTFF